MRQKNSEKSDCVELWVKVGKWSYPTKHAKQVLTCRAGMVSEDLRNVGNPSPFQKASKVLGSGC
jgi:hypothetical protein